MNPEQYLDYLQESLHIAYESYTDIYKMYETYNLNDFFQEFVQKQRDEKIDEILK